MDFRAFSLVGALFASYGVTSLGYHKNLSNFSFYNTGDLLWFEWEICPTGSCVWTLNHPADGVFRLWSLATRSLSLGWACFEGLSPYSFNLSCSVCLSACLSVSLCTPPICLSLPLFPMCGWKRDQPASCFYHHAFLLPWPPCCESIDSSGTISQNKLFLL